MTEAQRLLPIDEGELLQIETPRRDSGACKQAIIVTLILGAVCLFAWGTIDPFLNHPARDASLRGTIKKDSNVPSLYKAIGVQADEDFNFQRFAVSEGEEVNKGDILVVGTAHGEQVNVRAGFDGMVVQVP